MKNNQKQKKNSTSKIIVDNNKEKIPLNDKKTIDDKKLFKYFILFIIGIIVVFTISYFVNKSFTMHIIQRVIRVIV